jgi:hypothetical protein
MVLRDIRKTIKKYRPVRVLVLGQGQLDAPLYGLRYIKRCSVWQGLKPGRAGGMA